MASEATTALAPADPAGERGTPKRAAVIGGSLWTLGGYVVAQALRFAANLILSRLLFPEAFGLMALVAAVIQGLEMFSDVGLGPSIVHNPRGDDPRFLNTAWTIQALRGIALWLLTAALAVPVASFYGEPALATVLPVVGLTTVIAGFHATSLFTLSRRLSLRTLTLIEFTSQCAGLACMITWAVVRPEVWALVAGGLVTSLVKLLLSHWCAAGPRNRFAWDTEAVATLFRFGRWIFVSTVITFFVIQADRLIFGKMVPLGVLGVYSIGSMLAAMPGQALSQIGMRVAFPLYTRLLEAGGDLAGMLQRVRQPILLAGGFCTACLIAFGPLLIGLLYDGRYVDAGWIVSVTATGFWFSLLEATNGAAMLAMGKPKLVAAANGAKLLAMLVTIPVGHRLGGFPGAVAGFAIADLVKYAVSAGAAARLGLRAWPRDLALCVLIAASGVLAWFVADRLARVVPAAVAVLATSALAALVWLVPARRSLQDVFRK